MLSKIQAHLLSLKDEKYLKFNQTLNTTCSKPMIGIRVPLIRKYAKELLQEDNVSFKDEYYEEIMLHGFYIGDYKCDYQNKVKLINDFIPLIDNWGVCDGFVSSLKFINNYKDAYYIQVKKYLKSNNEYYQRFALVVLLSYYIEDKYLNDIYQILKDVKYNDYYSLMAGAWLLSYCFIFYYDETLTYVKENKLNDFVYKKGIQKSLDSFRITNKNKQQLRNLIKQTY